MLKFLVLISFLLFVGCRTVSTEPELLMSIFVLHYVDSSNKTTDTIFAEVCVIENHENSRTIRFFVDERVVGYFNFDLMGGEVDIETLRSFKIK